MSFTTIVCVLFRTIFMCYPVRGVCAFVLFCTQYMCLCYSKLYIFLYKKEIEKKSLPCFLFILFYFLYKMHLKF